MRNVLIFIMANFIYTNVFAYCNSSNLTQVISLLGKRESIMKEAAAYKWYHTPNHQASAYDAKQEAKVLKNVGKLASKMKIDPTSLMIFSQIQMDVSKQIESYWINYWNNPNRAIKEKPTKSNIENINYLRQNISSIDHQLFSTLPSEIPKIQRCTIKQLQPIFLNTFEKINGIASQPNFIDMLIMSLKGIKYNGSHSAV